MATEISDVSELQAIGSALSSDYILVNDIDASATSGWNSGAGFVPLGDASTRFTGNFDGDGYTISDLFIDRSGTDYVGLFGYARQAGKTIENVTLDGADITGKERTGACCGQVYSTVLSDVTVTNSDVTGSTYTGGVVGVCESSSATDLSFTGNVSGSGYVGGVVGWTDSATTSCVSSGTVAATVARAGGCIGFAAGTVSQCSSTSTVSSTSTRVGGLVGYSTGSVSQSRAAGNVTTTHNSSGTNVGGLIGEKSGSTVANCYALGNATAGASSGSVGGLIGYVSNAGAVDKCYSTGTPTGGSYVGGLIGFDANDTDDCFWDTTTSGTATSDGGTGKATAAMQDIDTYTDTATAGLSNAWDMVALGSYVNETWKIDDGNDYPVLGWETVEASEASASQTLAGLGQAASGAVHAQASVAQTLAGLGQQAAGTVEQGGAKIGQTLAPLGQQAAGEVHAQAGAAQTLAALGQAAAGEVHAQASAAQTLAGLGQQASGIVKNDTAGQAAQTLAALGQAAAGEVHAQGVAAQTLAPLGQQAAGEVHAQASAAQTLAPLGQQAAGEVHAQASAAQTLAALGQAASGEVLVQATATQTLAALGQAAAGEATLHWFADSLRLSDSEAVEVRHLAVVGTLPGVVPLMAAARNGTGTASLRYTTAGTLQYKAPGSDTWGPAVKLPQDAIPDDTWILRDGEDADKWLRVEVYEDYLPAAATTVEIELSDVFNNTVGQANCAAEDAAAGETVTWQITCTNAGAIAGTDHDCESLTFWLTQPAAGTLEISDDNATWVSPTTEGTGLVLGDVAEGTPVTLYVRRTLAAASDAAPTLLSQLHASFSYWGQSYHLDARGRFRVMNAAGYRFHFGALVPDADDEPDDTAAALPHSPADIFGDGTYYFAAAAYNGCMASGFLPVGPAGEEYLRLEIADGAQLGTPPVGAAEVRLEVLASGVVRVHAWLVADPLDSDLPDQWAIAYTADGSTPAEDAPDLTQTLEASGLVVFQYDLPAQADGATVTVRVQTRRNAGTDEVPNWIYSIDSTTNTATADADGPAATELLVASC